MREHRLTSYNDVFAAFCHPGLRQSLYDAGHVVMQDTLLTLSGDQHKQRRHLELRLFRREFARFYEQEIFPVTVNAILSPLVESGEADLVDFGYRVTMNLTADFAGIDRRENSASETDRLLRIVRTLSEGATLVHSERNHDAVNREVRSAQNELLDFLLPAWERRKNLLQDFAAGHLSETDLPRDILTILLRNQDRIELSDELIRREIGFYLQAGSHSTANSLVHASHEIFNWSNDLDALHSDPLLLQRAVHESMRLHPASPVAWREPLTNLELNGKKYTPDDRLILDIAAANRDLEVFGEGADQFRPDREILGSKTSRFGLTFGAGVHLCTGRDLDGGISQANCPEADSHQYGIVTQLLRNLLTANMRPNPSKIPALDQTTQRNNWKYYPVVFV